MTWVVTAAAITVITFNFQRSIVDCKPVVSNSELAHHFIKLFLFCSFFLVWFIYVVFKRSDVKTEALFLSQKECFFFKNSKQLFYSAVFSEAMSLSWRSALFHIPQFASAMVIIMFVFTLDISETWKRFIILYHIIFLWCWVDIGVVQMEVVWFCTVVKV